MSQLTETHDACLSQVYGLYGPGSMLCWYLLILSCMIQWTLHPHRRGKDTISVETIAVLLFPLASAWYLISLSLQAYQNAALHTDYCDLATCQASKAIEAPALVLYIWLTVIVFIYPLTLVYRPSLKRLSAFFLVFTAGLVAVGYSFDWVINSLPSIWKSTKSLSRHDALLPTCYQLIGSDTVQLVSYRFASRKRRGPAALEEQVAQQSSPQISLTDNILNDTLFDRLMGPRWVAAAFCIVSSQTKESWWWWAPMLYVSPQQWKRVLPETSSSWGDVDQMVAVVGGCVILGWNMCHMRLPWHPQRVQGTTEQQQNDKVTPSSDEALY